LLDDFPANKCALDRLELKNVRVKPGAELKMGRLRSEMEETAS
jgi:hypothetical protein